METAEGSFVLVGSYRRLQKKDWFPKDFSLPPRSFTLFYSLSRWRQLEKSSNNSLGKRILMAVTIISFFAFLRVTAMNSFPRIIDLLQAETRKPEPQMRAFLFLGGSSVSLFTAWEKIRNSFVWWRSGEREMWAMAYRCASIQTKSSCNLERLTAGHDATV